MANPSNSVRSVSIGLHSETSEGVLGRKGKYAIWNDGHNLSDVHSNAGPFFEGTRCTSLPSKIIAYVASFFGIGKILNVHISNNVASSTASKSLKAGEHTFWVDRNIDAYVEGFGKYSAKDLAIHKINTLWTSETLRIVAPLKTVSKAQKPKEIETLRSELFDKNWIENALLTIVTFGRHYRTTLKEEATQLYKQGRNIQQVEHFSQLKKHIRDIENQIPKNTKTPQEALNHIFAQLKTSPLANIYSEKVLRAAILATASWNARAPHATSWKPLKQAIFDASNVKGTLLAETKIRTLPRLLETIRAQRHAVINQNSNLPFVHYDKDAISLSIPVDLNPQDLLTATLERVLKFDPELSLLYTQEEMMHASEALKSDAELIIRMTMQEAFKKTNQEVNYDERFSNERLSPEIEWYKFSSLDVDKINLESPQTIFEGASVLPSDEQCELAAREIVMNPGFIKDFPRILSDITFENLPQVLKGPLPVIIKSVSETTIDGKDKTPEAIETESKDRHRNMVDLLALIDKTLGGGNNHSLIQNIQIMLTQGVKTDIFKPISTAIMSSESLGEPLLTFGSTNTNTTDEKFTFRIESPSKIHQTCAYTGNILDKRMDLIGSFKYTVEFDHVQDETGTWVIRNVRLNGCDAQLN